MLKRHKLARRLCWEILEARAVPAIDLSLVGSEINDAFATFAAAVRTSEAASEQVSGLEEGAGAIPALQAISSAASQIIPLQASLASALAGVPGASALVQQQTGVDGLGGQLAGIYLAGAAGLPEELIAGDAVPTVFQAVEGAILSSYQQTAADVFLASARTRAAPSAPGPVVDPLPPGSTLRSGIDNAVSGLAARLVGQLSTVPTASALIQGQLLGPGLAGQLDAITGTALAGSTDGTVTYHRQPALFGAVDLALAAAYREVAGEVYLDAAGQARPKAVALGTLGASIDGDFALAATAIRTAEESFSIPLADPTVSVGDVTVTVSATAGATAEVPITLSEPDPLPVTLSYLTGGGTAVAGTDYLMSFSTLVFTAGVTTQFVPIKVLASGGTPGTTKTFDVGIFHEDPHYSLSAGVVTIQYA